jgi:hypothetical protein
MARRVELVGKWPIYVGDVDINLQTVELAAVRLDRYELSRSRSTVSR